MSLMAKRIIKELEQLRNDPPQSFVAQCINNNLYEWHFTIRGPEDSDYSEGIYHGKIELPVDYPIKPPNIFFLTPNGRFEVKTKICLNITKFHPENWNPSWTIRTMIEGIIQHFHVKDFAVGSIQYTSNQIKSLALASHKWECDLCGPIVKLIAPKGKQDKKEEQCQLKKDDQIQEKKEDSQTEIQSRIKQISQDKEQSKPQITKENLLNQVNKQVEQKQKKEIEKQKEIEKNDLSDEEQETPITKKQTVELERLLWKAINPDFLQQTYFQLRTQNQQTDSLHPQQLQYFDQIYKMMEEEEKVQKTLILSKPREQEINKQENENQIEQQQKDKQTKQSSLIMLLNIILLILVFGIVFINFGEFVEQKAKEWLLVN